MNKKQKECFSPHIVIHSIFGLGLGIMLVSLIPSLNILWLGLALMALAFILDATRKG